MKIRNGFITNSSSSSFIISSENGLTKKDILNYLKTLISKRSEFISNGKRSYDIESAITYLGIPSDMDEASRYYWVDNKDIKRKMKSIIKNKSHYLLVTTENGLYDNELKAIEQHYNIRRKYQG